MHLTFSVAGVSGGDTENSSLKAEELETEAWADTCPAFYCKASSRKQGEKGRRAWMGTPEEKTNLPLVLPPQALSLPTAPFRTPSKGLTAVCYLNMVSSE